MQGFDTDEEILDIKKEIVESRGLLIKTNNLANSLAADIKIIAKRQANYERRFQWNGAAAYLMFATLAFLGLKLASDARIDEIAVEKNQLAKQLAVLRHDLKEEVRKSDARARTEQQAASFYELIRQNKQQEAVQAYSRLQREPLSTAEAAFFRDRVEAFRRQLSLEAMQRGLSELRANEAGKASESLRTALRFDSAAPHVPTVKLNLARALRRLHRENEAIALLQQVIAQNPERELQDEALWTLVECARALGDGSLARDTLRTLLAKSPRSPYLPEARRLLREISLAKAKPEPSAPAAGLPPPAAATR